MQYFLDLIFFRDSNKGPPGNTYYLKFYENQNIQDKYTNLEEK